MVFEKENRSEMGSLVWHVSRAVRQPSDLGTGQFEPEFGAKVSGL